MDIFVFNINYKHFIKLQKTYLVLLLKKWVALLMDSNHQGKNFLHYISGRDCFIPWTTRLWLCKFFTTTQATYKKARTIENYIFYLYNEKDLHIVKHENKLILYLPANKCSSFTAMVTDFDRALARDVRRPESRTFFVWTASFSTWSLANISWKYWTTNIGWKYWITLFK